MGDFVAPVTMKSLFSQPPGSTKIKPLGLQSQMFWELIFSSQDSQAGGPDVGLRTLTPVGDPDRKSTRLNSSHT